MESTTTVDLPTVKDGNTIGPCTCVDAGLAGLVQSQLDRMFPYNSGARYFAHTQIAVFCPAYSLVDNNRKQQKTPISNNP